MKTRLFSTLALLVLVLLNLGQTPAVTQATSVSGSTLQPLANLLQPDGSLNLQTSFRGSLDTHGWRMEITAGGPPRFVPAGMAAGDEKWDRRFFSPGTNIRVQALAISGSDVYVGGEFTQVGGIGTGLSKSGGLTVNRIARWDSISQTWSALGSGVNNDVFSITVSGRDVYVGGAFTSVDGQDIKYIARWDGSHWSALGSGVNSDVRAIAVRGSNVYVGGSFTTAGGLPASRIAVWNTLTPGWAPLGSGVGNQFGFVDAIAVSGDSVYVGGGFAQAGGVDANNIARWSGGAWSALGGNGGNGVNQRVRAIAVSGSNDVYVGGEFSKAGFNSQTGGGVSVNNIARWNGSSWFDVGGGATGNPFGWVLSLAVSGNNVYAGGVFTTAGGVTVNGMARWDGILWHALGSGVEIPEVWAIAVSGNDIYAGGNFSRADGGEVSHIARWDGSRWFGLGSSLDDYVQAIAASGSDVYAGGAFTDAGGVRVNKIARWNGGSWSPLGSGVNGFGDVYAVAVSGGDVYVGGDFTQIGGTPANRIARWDGSGWSALGSGVNDTVRAIAVSGGNVYAGGTFTTAGGATVNRMARWDGSNWAPLGSGANGTVNAIAVRGSDVYVGGSFTQVGGLNANRIAKWDGSSWSPLGGGVNGTVNAIAVSGNDFYVGGIFSQAGGVSANNIARWDGSGWSPLGSGVPTFAVDAITVLGGELYVGGTFTQAGGVSANNIARWDGSSWSALGSGVDQRVLALAVSGPDVYVGGLFTTAGGNPSVHFGRYMTQNTPPTLSYPNPVSVVVGGSLTVNPVAGPSDNGSVSAIVAQSVTPAGFTGTVTMDNTTGVVSISNAGPLGSFTVTIRATDNEGAFTDASFTLNVTNSPKTCVPQAKIIADDGVAGDQFGYAVAIDGDTLVIGAPFDDNPASGAVNQGAVYIYIRSDATWSLQQKLTAGDGTSNDYFGHSVAISGDSLVVGTPGAFSAEIPSAHPGMAYVFSRDGTSWYEEAKLVASDGATNDQFGWSVGISGDTVVVGARLDDANSGSAYVFGRNGGIWSQQQKLIVSTRDLFGWSVTISEETIVVGSPGDDIGSNISQGSVYVFTRSGATWSLQQRLFASTPGFMAAFGRAVAISGETLGVGADLDDIGANVNQGAVYVFTRSGATWSEQQKLIASDAAAGDLLGEKVAISDETIVAGSWLANIGANADQGAAYVFTRSGATWSLLNKLIASDGAASDQLGISVAISGGAVAVGSRLDDIEQKADQGSVYVFADCSYRVYLPLIRR